MSAFLNLNKFKIQSKIGQGAFGEVFKVEENDSKNIFAAKISLSELNQEDPKLFTDLKGEVSILSQLNHSSVLRFIGYSPFNFNQESFPVIISEYSTNGSLNDIIKLDREFKAPKQWTDTKKLINIYGIASAMSYLHSHNIIHRDLKPDNILEDDNFFPKIADFGLSKIYHQNIDSMTSQSSVGFKGTPIYSAPEIWFNGEYSKAIDVYAFSIIFYETFSIEEPFKNYKIGMLYSKVIINGERPEFNFPIPNCYKDLISRCWSPNPEDRPTFQEIVEELRTNKEFIIDTIDENEFYEFVDFIDEKGSSFETSKKLKTIILNEERNQEGIHNVRTFNNLPFKSQLLCICDMIENEEEEETENSDKGSLYDIKELLEYIETFEVNPEGKYFSILEDDEEASIEIICQQPPKISISSEVIEKIHDNSSIDSNEFNEHINKFENVEVEIKYPTKSFESIYEEVLNIKKKHEERIIINILINGIKDTDMKFRYDENIDSIIIGNDVLKIAGEPVYISRTYSFAGGGGSFCKCSSLKQITISSSVTEIGIASFFECSSLTQITIPSSVTKIENSAFWDCSSLSQISIPSSVTEIGECAFYGCSSLTQITIPSSVTEIARMTFYGCSSLTRIDIPSSVTLIKEMAFVNCSLLRRVIIPSSVTEIGKRAFKGCSSLTQISIPSSITRIGKYLFEDCSSLTQIKIPSSVIIIEKCAFKGCSSLKHITFPSSINEIQWNAFENCSSLTNIKISSSETAIKGDAFRGCISLKQIMIPSFEIDIDYSAFANCLSFELASISSSSSSSVTENCSSPKNEISVKKMGKISEEEIVDSQNKNEPQQEVNQSNDTSQISHNKINEIDSYSVSKNDGNSLIDEFITTRDPKRSMNDLNKNREEEIINSQIINEPQQEVNQSNDTSHFSNDKIIENDSSFVSKNDGNSLDDGLIATRDSKRSMNDLNKICEEEIINSQIINKHEQEVNQSNDTSQFSNDKIMMEIL